jgi:hypothetical protein
MMKKERFSKRALAQHISAQLDCIMDKWGFDVSNGTSQLVKYKEPDAAIDYGRKEALLSIMDEFNLWSHAGQ